MQTHSEVGFGEAEVSKHDIIQALHSTCEVFLNFFLYEQLIYNVPEFHKRIWALMTTVALQKVVIAVPRGHAKTTLAKLAVVWYFLFSPLKFIVYVSNTADVAIKSVQDIIDFFSDANFVKLFGPIKLEVDKRGEGEFVFYLNTPFHGRKKCVLKARGANQQIRGLNIGNQRPEMAVVDDLEDAENTENEKLQKKLDKWFLGTFIKALDKKVGKVVVIGNYVSETCLLARLIDDPDWHSMRLGAILANGQSLWPDLWPLQELIDDYKAYQRLGYSSLWFAEMMNLIIAGENCLIQPDDIPYEAAVEPEFLHAGFITIDPATGTGGDDTAIVVHGLVTGTDQDLRPMVIDYRFGQLDELATVREALELAFQWGIRIVCIESIAYQRALATLFELVLMQKGITDFEILKTYPGNVSKLLRLKAFAALLKSNGYALPAGEIHITNQLISFDTTRDNNRDDLIDACAMGPEVIKQHAGLILSKRMHTLINVTPTRASALC